MKKNIKNIMLGSISVIGVSTILVAGLSTIEINKKQTVEKDTIVKSSKLISNETILTSEMVKKIGWNSKKTITLSDWKTMAPNITKIGYGAFDSTKIESIIIPSSIMSIEPLAFAYTENLLSLNFEQNSQLKSIGFQAFEASSLKSIIIPESVKSIGNFAFASSQLSSITISNPLIEIGNSTFLNTTSLKNITINDKHKPNLVAYGFSIKQINSMNFKTSSSNEKATPEYRYTGISLDETQVALLNWNTKTTITLADWIAQAPNVQVIIGDAFKDNTTLTSIEFPPTLQSILNHSFWGASALTNVVFQNNPIENLTIQNNAFEDTGITSLNFVSTKLLLSNSSFIGMNHLTSIEMPALFNTPDANTHRYGLTQPQWDSIIWTGFPSFSGTHLSAVDVRALGWDTKEIITIDDWAKFAPNVISIQENAFANAMLKNIHIPKKIESIELGAFSFNLGLESVIFEGVASITNIGQDAFKGNPKLERITIPNSVTTMGTGVFSDSGLKFITFQDNSRLTAINDGTFKNSKIESIIIPPSVTSINGPTVFLNTPNLTRIKMKYSLVHVGETHRWGLTQAQWNLIEFTFEPFLGTSLNRLAVRNLGWDKKTTITLADWIAMAPNVTNLNGAAFRNNLTLTSIDIPKTIVTIGDQSFHNASNLKIVNFEPNNNVLTTINGHAFQSSGVENLNLPHSITDLGQAVFSNMTSLRSVILPPNLKVIPYSLVSGAINLETMVLPPGLETIEGNAFANTNKFTKIDIPISVVSIHSESFINTYFTDITMSTKHKGDDVAKYGFTQTQWDSINWAYEPFLGTQLDAAAAASIGWHSKVTITLDDWRIMAPNVVTMVGTFPPNWTLANMQIPKKITTIGLNTFNQSNVLRNITFEEGSLLTHIGVNAFWRTGLITINLPDSVLDIGEGAFRYNDNLISFNFPPQVTVIPKHMLARSRSLQDITIGPNITEIGWSAFAENLALTKIIIPDNVTIIGEGVFNTTPLLMDITMPAKFKTTIPNYGFTQLQWNAIKWTGNVTITDNVATSFDAEFMPNRDINSQTPPVDSYKMTASESVKVAGFKLKFALGSSASNLIIDWNNPVDFDHAIHNYSDTKDILLSEMNVFAKMYLPAGTGPDADTIGLVKYIWNKEPVKVYDSSTGTIGDFWIHPFDGSRISRGSIVKTNSKVLDGWSNDLQITGNKITEVSITSSTFDIAYYKVRGIDLQVAQRIVGDTGAVLTWENIDEFGVKKYDATIHKTFVFRLNISDANRRYHLMHGSNALPSGQQTEEVEKTATGKMELPVNLGNLSNGDYIITSGSVLDMRVFESDDLFTFPPETVGVMKQMIRITYSFQNSPWMDTTALNNTLGALRGDALNSLILNESIRARYEFTELGKASFFSSSVFGDPDYVPTDNFISLTHVRKDYDLTSFVEAVPRVMADGDTTNITWTNTLDLVALEALGVKLEWNYWTRDTTNNIVRSEWTTTPPDQVSVLENPVDLSVFPIAIRFVNSITHDNNGLFDFSTGRKLSVDTIKGYEPNISALGEIFAFTETLGINYIATGLSGNVVTMSVGEKTVDVSAEAQAKLEVQFSLGTSPAEPTIPWSDKTAFHAAIQEYSSTNDILQTELNIYMKLILVGGTGPAGDVVDGITHIWDRREVEIYNNETGLNGTFSEGIAGSFIRTYSKIISNWSSPLSVEGIKSSEVKILNRDNAFDIEYYAARGIHLQATVDGELWYHITSFNSQVFNAAATDTMSFKLVVKFPHLSEMYGDDVPITTPPGTTTNIVTKDVIAKIELTGILANNLTTDKLQVSGTTNNLVIVENDELYTASGMSVEEAKTMFEIKYSFDGTTYFAKDAFISALNGLRTTTLNNLVLAGFKVRYEFTEAGLGKYYSTEVFNDPDATPDTTIKTLAMVGVIKTLDLNEYITNVANVELSGTTLDIRYANELDVTALSALGVKIQWSYWTKDATNNVVRSEWVDEKPTSVSILKNPTNPNDLHPVAIRFVKLNETNNSIELKTIVENVTSDTDIVKGYATNITGLNEIITFSEQLGTNYQVSGVVGNVVSMTIKEEQISVSEIAKEKLQMQFAIGPNTEILTIPWANATDFKSAIATFNDTQDILKANLNIYMKLVLVGGTGPDSNIINDIKYVWDNRVVEVYNNETGVNAEFDTIDTAGSKLRAYAKIADNWADSLSAEGNISSNVLVTSLGNVFDIGYYSARGIKLEASVDETNWVLIDAFNTTPFDASETNKMSFRLSVVDPSAYEIHGSTVTTTTPPGTTTNIVTKDIIAKIELTGILANNLTTDKLQVSGTTNNLVILENDELYTASGMSVEEAKTMFEIKYSFDGTTYFAKDAFISALNELRTTALNSLVLIDFSVRYEFTEAGLAKYYSTEVFNDPDSSSAITIKTLSTTGVIKTLDLNEYITNVANVQLSGTTLDIRYANELDATALSALGVKIQWSYWTKDATNNVVRSEWVDEKPTSVSILKNPTNPDDLHPIAIRFVKLDEANMSIELKTIVENVASDTDIIKGYATDITGLNEIFTFSEILGTNYQVSGVVGNVVSMTIKEEQISVSEIAKEKLQMQFAIGQNVATLTIPWANATDFKSAIASFNETQDILKTELNIYMKLVLVGGTGPDSNIINDIKYVWDNRVIEVYNNVTGVNAEFNTIDPAGSKLRAYAKIADNWADSLTAEGNKSSSVLVSSLGDVFDIRYYTARGIKLEASVDETNWVLIDAFNTTPFDASETNKMSFRLSVIDSSAYEIYGSTVTTTTPPGTTTNIVTKDIIAKIELTGILANNLTTDKLQVSGTTNNLVIVENDELYTASGMSVEEAKTMFEIKYSFDGTTYFAKDAFISALNGLRTTTLNSLVLANFKVRYEFTEAGLGKYYSTEVFNDPDATPDTTIKTLSTTGVIKTLDLNEYITNVANVQLSGTTLDIRYANELDATALSALGVKIQWSYWTKDATNNVVRSEWVDEKPTSVSILKNPTNPDDLHPIAIRFVKLDEANMSIELKTIVENVASDTDIIKGYAPNITGLNEIIALSEILGTNYQVSGVAGNVVSMTIKEEQISVSEIAKEKMEMKFAIGTVSNNLTIDWANAADFKSAIETFNQSNDILKTQLNIYMKLVLIGGTGTNSDIIGDTRYTWDNRVVEVYNNETGVNAEFDTIDPAGSKLRAYARIPSNWADSLSAEGNKSNAVYILSQDNVFDIRYYISRGIKLEVSVNGTTDWLPIDAFGTLPIDASETNKMSFRLSVVDPSLYEMYGDVIEVTDPIGTKTQIVTKDIIAKIELIGVVASDLTTDKLQVSGTTHDFVITESDELYTISGMSVLEAKKWFEIKYSFDGTTYLVKNEFTKVLNEMRGLVLNNLELINFKVRYEFTDLGLAKYYSPEIFNDSEALPTNTIKDLNTTNITKSIDVTQEIASIANIELTGTTENLTWAGMELINNISEFVNVEYGTYIKTDTGVAYSWSVERPTSLYTKTTPEGYTNFPVAIRFIPKLPADKVEIGSINESTSLFIPVNTELGYEVNTSKITTIINIDTTELVNKLLLTGYANALNGGATADVVEQQAIELVDPIYQNDVKLSYEISIRPGVWHSFDELKEFMLSYYNDFANENSGIIIFDNGVIPGVQITAKFVSKIPDAFIINATPDAQTLLKTDNIKTNIDLREYVKVLQTVKVIPSGTTSADVGTLLIPGMTPGNILFGGKTYAQIERILSSSIQMEFKAPGFHGDAWVTLDQITAVNFNNELFIRFVVKTDAEKNIELSLVGENDYKDHLVNGFQLKIALPKEIQVDSNDLIKFISVTGNTKNILINDSKVYEDLIIKDPIYEGKVQILYTIGTVPMHLDPTQPDKFEFTKEEIISLLATNILDITLVQKQLTARYALANGISEDDFIIKDDNPVNLKIENILLFINKSNYYTLASKLKVSGTSSEIVWGQEIIDLQNALSEGLIIQYSIDPSALALDAIDNPKWNETQPTTISPTDKFLSIRLVTKTGYIFEESIKMFVVNTSNVLLIIELQKAWMQNITITGNTKNINIDTTKLENFLATSEVPGKEFIVIQYYFGESAPLGLDIPAETKWFTAVQIKRIFESLQGSKNEQELILFRDSLKSRFSLTNEGFKDYRLNIDGVNSDEQAPSKPEFYESLITSSLNISFKGYINLNLINTFKPDSFKIVGSDTAPILEVGNKIGEMLDYYKDPATSPFDIYYTNVQGDFSNKEYKLFGNNGFISEFHPNFKIDLDINGDAKPIWFKLEARNGYQVWENNRLLAGGKIIKITNIVVEKQIRNPLTEAPDIRFNAIDGSNFYQGSGSFSVYVKGTTTLVDSDFLNATHPDIVPAVLKLEYNISEFQYTPEELEEVTLDKTKWVDEKPTNLSVGQFVMTRVAINNDKFTMLGSDTITPQTRVKGLMIHADELSVDPNLKLTNIDYYGYDAIDGQTRIEEAKLNSDPMKNYLGADLIMSVETEFYKNTSGTILIDTNGIPIVKRNPVGSTQDGTYKDGSGLDILDHEGNPIPIWTIQEGGRTIPAAPIRTGVWQSPIKMQDGSFLGTFSQEETSSQWKLFNNQFIKLSFVPRIGEGTPTDPDFIFDTSLVIPQEIELNDIKYSVQTNGVKYEFIQNQVENITYKSDDGEELPYTGNAHISSELTILRKDNITEKVLKGQEISDKIKTDFDGKVEINMLLNRKNGSPQSASGTNISQFKDLQNGDIITISFQSSDDIFLLPQPIEPLIIVVKDLYVKPLSDDLFKYLRPNFVGTLNGSGSFDVKVTNPNNPTDTNEAVLGINQWYEYQVWNPDKTLKTEWTKDETKINNLVNGDKVEWKIINKEGVFSEDYYNTLLDNANMTDNKIKFRVVDVVDNIEKTVMTEIGSSQEINPDINGVPQYPTTSGWVVSGLKVEITLDEVQKSKFETTLNEIKLTFSGVDKFGTMQSSIINDGLDISKDVELVWYTTSQGSIPRKITNFAEAGLSNGDMVWATIAPSLQAEEANLIIDESISSMKSEVFPVSGLTILVQSSTQILMIALISASSVVFVGLVGLMIFVKRNKKLNNNKLFKK